MHIEVLLSQINAIIENRETKHYNTSYIIEKGEIFLDMIDLDTVFPKIWGMMGANIWLNHSHFNIYS